ELGSWPPSGEAPRRWRTATIADLTRGGALTVLRTNPASSRESDTVITAITIEDGDVLLQRTAGAEDPPAAARVADRHDAGSPLDAGLIIVRPDRRRLDPWFLAGFLAAQDNISSATTGTLRSNIQIDPKRLRVPLLPLAEQRAYGDAFRRVHELRIAAREAAELVASTTELLTLGLTSGALAPPDSALEYDGKPPAP
ncbi:MAG: N-6 DNA methylase, partial [Solirubrobacteraceae bacterium]